MFTKLIIFSTSCQVEGFKMNLIYYDLYQATRLEKFVTGMPRPIFEVDSYLLLFAHDNELYNCSIWSILESQW